MVWFYQYEVKKYAVISMYGVWVRIIVMFGIERGVIIRRATNKASGTW